MGTFSGVGGKFEGGSPVRHVVAAGRSLAHATIPAMHPPLNVPPRAAGYVVLTSMAAGLELIRNGWSETRADLAGETPGDAADGADDPEPAGR